MTYKDSEEKKNHPLLDFSKYLIGLLDDAVKLREEASLAKNFPDTINFVVQGERLDKRELDMILESVADVYKHSLRELVKDVKKIHSDDDVQMMMNIVINHIESTSSIHQSVLPILNGTTE